MPVFLHAAHQVRTAFDGLALVSWLVIGLGLGALVLTWGRILAWLRQPETSSPAVRAWGEDESGWYFEIANAGGRTWSLEVADGSVIGLVGPGEDGLAHAPATRTKPVALSSSEGTRLTL